MSQQTRNHQFNICERINRARALLEGVYMDTGSDLAVVVEKQLSKLFDEQFALLIEKNNQKG